MRRPILLVLAVAGCAPSASKGMSPIEPRALADDPSLVELASVAPNDARRALLVVYPRSACSGSARMVFVDRRGRFQGALGPGEAALLDVPNDTRLVAISSVEIEAPVESWHVSEIVTVPPAPSGIVLHADRVDGRRCGRNGQYASPSRATREELEALLSDREVRWLTPRREEGQAWLDAHRARLDVILAAR